MNEFLEPENVGQGLPINYKELVQMIYGSKKVNAEKIISERRKNEGRDTGITDSIIDANRLAITANVICHYMLFRLQTQSLPVLV